MLMMISLFLISWYLAGAFWYPFGYLYFFGKAIDTPFGIFTYWIKHWFLEINLDTTLIFFASFEEILIPLLMSLLTELHIDSLGEILIPLWFSLPLISWYLTGRLIYTFWNLYPPYLCYIWMTLYGLLCSSFQSWGYGCEWNCAPLLISKLYRSMQIVLWLDNSLCYLLLSKIPELSPYKRMNLCLSNSLYQHTLSKLSKTMNLQIP